MGNALQIVLIIAGIMIAAGLSGIARMRYALVKNGRERRPEETIYPGESGRNALILYQPSPHGTADNAARIAAEALHDLGYTAVMNFPSSKLAYDLKQYQVLTFGSAVYIGTVSAALVRYLKENSFEGKKVLLFVVGQDSEEKGELVYLEKLVGEGNMISKVKLSKGKENLVDKIIRQQFQ